MISKSTIAKIVETAQIEEVVRDFVTLKKRGTNYIGLCPFHNEKTPSFNVSPAKGIYKCFGCGKGGDAIEFIKEHEKYSFEEALRYLANKYRIGIEETESTQEEKQKQANDESLFIINNFAQQYFSEKLFNNEEGKSVGLSYFKERQFREETIKKFQLGYALDSYDAFMKEALSKGYNLELLKKIGLLKEKDGKVYDFYRGRVMFPIHNLSGKIIGFGGRILKKEKSPAKYINSPESEIYNKSKVLFGLFFAKKSIPEKDECLLVEGYTDVISLHQGGIENVVASSGTSLTQEQVRLIKRYTENITIVYDGDAAGIKAALRGLELVLEVGMNVKIVVLPEPEDPDSFIQKVGATEFLNYINANKKDFILFKTNILLKDAENDIAKKGALIKDIVEIIAIIPDPIKRQLYLKECSKLMKVDEQILIGETNKVKRKAMQKETTVSKDEAETMEQKASPEFSTAQEGLYEMNSDDFQERDVVRILLEHGQKNFSEGVSVAEYILKEIEEIKIDNPLYAKMLKEFSDEIAKGTVPDANYFVRHPEPAISQLAIELLASPYQLSENWEKHGIFVGDKNLLFKKDIDSSLSRLKLKKVLKLLAENEAQLKETKDETAFNSKMKIHQTLMQWKSELSKQIGTVIVK